MLQKQKALINESFLYCPIGQGNEPLKSLKNNGSLLWADRDRLSAGKKL